MERKPRIWVDVDNSPHVPFFLPLIREMEKLGYEVTITARDCFQTCGLLEMAGRQYTKVGRHYGKNLLLKAVGLVIRALQLYRFGRGKNFSIAVSHGSRSLVLAAFLLRIPVVNIDDYEFSKFGPFLKWMPAKQLVPEVIPETALNGMRRVVKYPGLKEEVYVGEFEPDASIIGELGIDSQKVIVSVRPPATEAHYHEVASEKIFAGVMDYLMRQQNVVVIVLPRNEKQTRFVLKLIGGSRDNVVIPRHVVNGLNLIWHSDLVISGGGTMNREAAALGVRVYSIFGGKVGAVDRFLEGKGKMEFIKDSEDIERIRIQKSGSHTLSYQQRSDLVNFLVSEIVAVTQE